ncbi:pyridoxine 5'-phosphate synthase [Rapidithrix thailandica]|uniref:Pyridoxine 5'-phosphate synthase n=1 Tax=Rapidithrix thailandica TaxID=413964 RepID=A0AAW9RQJ4_9BACT
MTKLSVNINKFATLRNARGKNNPDLIQVVKDCERFGAQGITVHPRPDERHIRYDDVLAIKEIVTTEFNIEGNPKDRYMQLVLATQPTQATLVPDAEDAITSNAGWDTLSHQDYLKEIIQELKNNGIRTSIFVDPEEKFIEGAAKLGTDRIELYTEAYAEQYSLNKEKAIESYRKCAILANELGLELNAGHDLSLENLNYFYKNIPNLKEVSIGHALICDALYLGIENTIQMYRRQLQ